MTFKKVMLSTLLCLDVPTATATPYGELLQELLKDFPDEFEFSIGTSTAALERIPGAQLPKPSLEIEEWIQDTAAELHRLGTVVHALCKCGDSEADHIFSLYIQYVLTYIEIVLYPKLEHIASNISERIEEIFADSKHFRPNDN